MSKHKVVWTDGIGDLRKASSEEPLKKSKDSSVDLKQTVLSVRRLTSGKGRTVVEISNLPNNEVWCEELAKKIKKALGVGGTYKNKYIEIHGEKIDLVTQILDKNNLKWKKTGG